MKEPKRIPLDPTTPKPSEVDKIPMPPLYPESMTDDVVSGEQVFLNFIQKAKASKQKYEEEKQQRLTKSSEND
tara:strand:- start:380 stop:598 length:219 start_codon:yes stop_codon:yes gene_type:complete